MEISNQKRINRFKRSFNISIVFLLLLILFFVLKEIDLGAIISGALLFLTIFVSQFFQFNYIYYNSNGDKILIRYYPVIAFFGKEYSSVEFDKRLLYYTTVKRMFIFSDLYIAIKTSKGVAEYPEISLMGLSKDEINDIEKDLRQYMKQPD